MAAVRRMRLPEPATRIAEIVRSGSGGPKKRDRARDAPERCGREGRAHNVANGGGYFRARSQDEEKNENAEPYAESGDDVLIHDEGIGDRRPWRHQRASSAASVGGILGYEPQYG